MKNENLVLLLLFVSLFVFHALHAPPQTGLGVLGMVVFDISVSKTIMYGVQYFKKVLKNER